ncbi:MAG: hypothetical protein IJW48_04395 [Clostridia bacterium]|nr:hypothetical protein [Clostridia bacterium]
MLFGKNEKKRGHPGVALTMGALAVVGAVSLVNTSKKWMKEKGKKMIGFFRGMGTNEMCDD